MRVTHRMLVRSALRDLQASTQRLGAYQEQLSSGKRIHRPSDDPFGVQRALGFRGELKALEVCRQNISLSQDWLNATEITLDKLADVIIRARDVAIRGADDSVGQEARQALAAEAAQLLGSALQVANTSSQGRFLFAGYRIDQVPFGGQDEHGSPTDDPSAIVTVVYNGDSGAIVRELEPGVSLQINFTGAESWLDPDSATSVFAALIDLRDSLAAGDGDGVRDALGSLDTVLDMAVQARAVAGAKLQRLSLAGDKLEAVSLGLQSLLSATEDVDMAEAVVNYAQQEAVYRAALQVNSRILPMSLLDYLK